MKRRRFPAEPAARRDTVSVRYYRHSGRRGERLISSPSIFLSSLPQSGGKYLSGRLWTTRLKATRWQTWRLIAQLHPFWHEHILFWVSECVCGGVAMSLCFWLMFLTPQYFKTVDNSVITLFKLQGLAKGWKWMKWIWPKKRQHHNHSIRMCQIYGRSSLNFYVT